MDYYLLLDWRACICIYYNTYSWGHASNFGWLMHKHTKFCNSSLCPFGFLPLGTSAKQANKQQALLLIT